ncbi:MAG: hypothetical protein ACRBG0_13650 [Lewinella sp.]|uniref:hypothetical protein n=1 Tax=Lewinella sp. TaxID=2004506 RepID=UPI003D6AC03C
MCKTQTAQYIFELHLKKSKRDCLRPLINQYNQGRPLREQLRSAHIKLAEHILNLYYARLSTAQGAGSRVLLPGQPLPTLRTSNGALANEMSSCKRTIINLRQRLEDAGIIAYAAWHGTNSSYELDINPMAMHLQTKQVSDNHNSLFFSVEVKTLRHIETGNLLQDTNKLINKSGAPSPTGTDNQSFTVIKDVENTQNVWKEPKEPVENAASESAQDTFRQGNETIEIRTRDQGQELSPPSSAAPPRWEPAETLPGDLQEALSHIEDIKDRNEAERIGRSVWAYAHQVLFSDKWLSDNVKREAQIAITEYLAWYNQPGGYQKAKIILRRRIRMVRGWLDRDPALKKQKLGDLDSVRPTRWIPLPNKYFDMRNEHGFHKTQQWYNDSQAAKIKSQRDEALNRAMDQYEKSLLAGAQYGPDQAYHVLTQELRKKHGSAIIREFQERIAQLQTA